MISDGIREVRPEPTDEPELARLRERVAILEALTASPLWSHRALCEKLSGTLNSHFGARFMDPPDGGDVPLHVQVERMACALNEAEAALKPFANMADIFDQPSSNRPRSGEIMSWVDHRVGERVLTVEMLRTARERFKGSGSQLADATNKDPSP